MSKLSNLSAQLKYAQGRLSFYQTVKRAALWAIGAGTPSIIGGAALLGALPLTLGIIATVLGVATYAAITAVPLDRRPRTPGYTVLRDEDPTLPARFMPTLDYWTWQVDLLGQRLADEVSSA